MKLTLTIQCDNAAFEEMPEDEVARILQALAREVRGTYPLTFLDGHKLLDKNGNTVGRVRVED